MQVAAPAARASEQPMSWARALVLATGFFFLAAILVAQVPGYFYTVSTLATLASFEQGTLDLALLAIGMGLVAVEIGFLYDPRPLLPPALFALAGAAIAAVGGFLLVQVYNQVFPALLPDQGYLIHPAWFQKASIDLRAVGMLALLVGGAMVVFAVLCRPVLAGRLSGARGTLVVRLLLAVSFAILAIYFTVFTFSTHTILGGTKDTPQAQGTDGAVGNVLLFIALGAALTAIAIWLLPVMVSRRKDFMPAVYLHGAVGLIGSVGVPLLLLWVIAYPLVNLIHNFDSTQFLVQCSQKALIPASCTFTPYTGYIIVAIVIGGTFTFFAAGLYFWRGRRDTVLLGALIGIIYVGLAATIIHTGDPVQLPIGLIVATAIALLGFAFIWASQNEFASDRAEALGCTGQWLVLGTGLLIYLAGFAFFSIPNFFESEALGLYYTAGRSGLHDALWGFLLMAGLAAMQFVLLVRREPMSQLRKFILWTLLIAVALELVGAIQGFHHDLLAGGWNVA
ncbi:MAG TPA: hypothetical protein VGR57_11720 [Ktedonobacterales bacterium]|nr:hypothetical protein [Ktedonobacterales bacterium]